MDHYQVRSTARNLHLPVSHWHEQSGDPTVAVGDLDRLVQNAHCIEMRGNSMRSIQSKAGGWPISLKLWNDSLRGSPTI